MDLNFKRVEALVLFVCFMDLEFRPGNIVVRRGTEKKGGTDKGSRRSVCSLPHL